jgi:hypothetical protein
MTRFTKPELCRVLLLFDLLVNIFTDEGYALRHAEALLYLLVWQFSRGVTHATVEDDIHGSQSGQNIAGYKWLVWYLDAKYFDLIGPRGLEIWVNNFLTLQSADQEKDFPVQTLV